ncbi:MAG: hypothetical protein DWQ08_13625 [Proteobacteria bacterium]|nr:MAG: hypothetical protein DWQ08_13625 [Pseudomonadota bacterium]
MTAQRLKNRFRRTPRRPGAAWLTVLLVATCGLIASGLFIVLDHDASGIRETADVDPVCDIQRNACTAAFSGDRRVTLTLSPRPVKPVSPFTVSVDTGAIAARKVKIDFAGEGMDMGFNRPELSASGDNRFEGRATLSVCTLDRMYWRATVLVDTDGGVLTAPFRFVTTH